MSPWSWPVNYHQTSPLSVWSGSVNYSKISPLSVWSGSVNYSKSCPLSVLSWPVNYHQNSPLSVLSGPVNYHQSSPLSVLSGPVKYENPSRCPFGTPSQSAHSSSQSSGIPRSSTNGSRCCVVSQGILQLGPQPKATLTTWSEVIDSSVHSERVSCVAVCDVLVNVVGQVECCRQQQQQQQQHVVGHLVSICSLSPLTSSQQSLRLFCDFSVFGLGELYAAFHDVSFLPFLSSFYTIIFGVG